MLVAAFLRDFADMTATPYRDRGELVRRGIAAVLATPRWWPRAWRFVTRQELRLGGDLLRSGGRVRKLTFFVQNVMDAQHLEQGRIQACSFMVMTDTGPVSMCEHNARRDDYILKPLDVT